MKNKLLEDKLYYSTTEVAKYFGVNSSFIRHWEDEFEEIQPRRNKKGNRKFSKEDIITIEKIFFLVKEKGYTLDGAKEYLKNNKNSTIDLLAVINKLQHIKQELQNLSNNL